MIYGITGKIASGKNYIASIIQTKGIEVLDLDTMAKDSYEILGESIKREFGTTDRRKIASIVFTNQTRLCALENIIYPYITEQILEHEKETDKPFFINGALIRRAGLDKHCKAIIYVEASLKLRYTRAARRNAISKEEFIARDKSQNDVDYVTNAYQCPIEEIVNEQNTHLKTDVNNVLKKLGLADAITQKVHDLDLPELSGEKKEKKEEVIKKKTSLKKYLIPALVVGIAVALVFLALSFVPEKTEETAQNIQSPIEKPQIAQVLEELSVSEEPLKVVLPQEVSVLQEEQKQVVQKTVPVIKEIKETVQKPHLLKPAVINGYRTEKENRRKAVFDNLPSDLKQAVSELP